MPLYTNYAGKADPSKPYRVDHRATVGTPLIPKSGDVTGGPDRLPVSGARLIGPSGQKVSFG
jgi:hypothetical protein